MPHFISFEYYLMTAAKCAEHFAVVEMSSRCNRSEIYIDLISRIIWYRFEKCERLAEVKIHI